MNLLHVVYFHIYVPFKSLLLLYRLPVLLVRSKMAENLKSATQLIEQGHVRVGTDIVKDPAFLVTRNLEDFVTWVDTSAIKRHVMDYKDIRDDFDINCWNIEHELPVLYYIVCLLLLLRPKSSIILYHCPGINIQTSKTKKEQRICFIKNKKSHESILYPQVFCFALKTTAGVVC